MFDFKKNGPWKKKSPKWTLWPLTILLIYVISVNIHSKSDDCKCLKWDWKLFSSAFNLRCRWIFGDNSLISNDLFDTVYHWLCVYVCVFSGNFSIPVKREKAVSVRRQSLVRTQSRHSDRLSVWSCLAMRDAAFRSFGREGGLPWLRLSAYITGQLKTATASALNCESKSVFRNRYSPAGLSMYQPELSSI